MNKQVLSIKQMQHLRELGVDTSKASMCRVFTIDEDEQMVEAKDVKFDKFGKPLYIEDGEEYHIYEHLIDSSETFEKGDIELFGTFTIQNILDMLPREITKGIGKCRLNVCINNGDWEVSYNRPERCVEYSITSNLLESAYNIFVWCAENGYLKGDKQ